jgi:hypothetical protein
VAPCVAKISFSERGGAIGLVELRSYAILVVGGSNPRAIDGEPG